jgi:hypothetical protein
MTLAERRQLSNEIRSLVEEVVLAINEDMRTETISQADEILFLAEVRQLQHLMRLSLNSAKASIIKIMALCDELCITPPTYPLVEQFINGKIDPEFGQ